MYVYCLQNKTSSGSWIELKCIYVVCLGKNTRVRTEFLSQAKTMDFLIWCARIVLSSTYHRIDIECSNTISIHMIPEWHTNVRVVSVRRGHKSGLVSPFTWGRCLNEHVVTYKNGKINIIINILYMSLCKEICTFRCFYQLASEWQIITIWVPSWIYERKKLTLILGLVIWNTRKPAESFINLFSRCIYAKTH